MSTTETATPSETAEATLAVVVATAPSTSPSLDKSLVMGIAWTGGMKWATQLISWASTIIVTRLLSPADYGILGMASVYLGLVALINDIVLGTYTIGWEVATVPVERVSALVGQVTPSIFSSIQHDRQQFRRYYLAIVPLRLLAAYAGIRSVDTVTPQVLIFGGHSRESMWFNIRATCILPVLFYFATWWGAMGVAATWVVAYPIVVFPIYRLVFKILDLSPLQYLTNLWPAMSGTMAMAVVVSLVRWLLRATIPPHLMLGIVLTFGASTYVLVILSAYRDRVIAFRELLRSIPSSKRREA